MGSLTHDHLPALPYSQITPKSAQVLSYCRQDAHTHACALMYRCRHKLASMPRHALHTTRPRVCVGRLPSPQHLQMAVVQEGRDGALQRAQTVPNPPIALLATPLHNPFSGPRAPRRCARRARRALARPLIVCMRVLCAEDPAMLCAQRSCTLARIAPLEPSPCAH
jgi:hypothetical protein